MARQIKLRRRLDPAPFMSAEQQMLHELFGGGGKVLFGNYYSECRPQVNGVLMPQKFMRPGIYEETTGDFFGVSQKRRDFGSRTSEMFGRSSGETASFFGVW